MTKNQGAELKAGQLLTISEGCYSDFCITGFFVALQTFKPMELLQSYMAEHADQASEYRFNSTEFLQYILNKGLLLEIQYATLHLGDYSNAGEVRFESLSGDQQ